MCAVPWGPDYSEALQAGCCQPSALRYPFGTRASTPFRLRAPLVWVMRVRLSQSAYGLVFEKTARIRRSTCLSILTPLRKPATSNRGQGQFKGRYAEILTRSFDQER